MKVTKTRGKVPPPKTRPRKYPFLTMPVGTDVLLRSIRETRQVGTCIARAQRLRGVRFTTRKEAGGVRIYCISKVGGKR